MSRGLLEQIKSNYDLFKIAIYGQELSIWAFDSDRLPQQHKKV